MEADKEEGVLERFMKEFFPFAEFQSVGFFTKEMKGDYEAQAKIVCDYFGYKTVYEYGAEVIECHLSYRCGKRLDNESFLTVIPSIYN